MAARTKSHVTETHEYTYFSHIISHYWILTFRHGSVFYCVFWTLIHVFGIWNTNRLKEAVIHTQNVQGKKNMHIWTWPMFWELIASYL